MSNDNTPDTLLDDSYEISLQNQELDHMEQIENDDEHDPFLSDAEADGDALASAGMGTDEDYGCYGGGDE